MGRTNSRLFILLFCGALFADHWETIFSFDAPSHETNGLAWDGRFLWHSNNTFPILYQINPVTGLVIRQITTNVPDQGDIAWLQGFLYVVSENEHIIYKINPATGATEDQIYVPVIDSGKESSSQMEAIESDGRYLWVDGNSNIIAQVDPETKQVIHWTRNFTYGYADGLGYAWGHLFVATNNPAIFEIVPCTGQKLQEFAAPAGLGFGPEGMTFDGEFLWYADNTTDKIYKIQLVDDFFTKRRVLAKAEITCGDVGVSEVLSALPLSVSVGPNPFRSTDKISLDFQGGSKNFLGEKPAVSIFDLAGRLLYSEHAALPAVLGWPRGRGAGKGLYLLACAFSKETFYKKILIL